MSEIQPYTQQNLPRKHLSESSPHFLPFRARYEGEIARRKDRRPGSLILEQQADGSAIARHMLARLEKHEIDDDNFVVRNLAYAGINSSWYMFARGKRVMDRRLVLPKLVSELEDGSLEIGTRAGLIKKASAGMVEVATKATNYLLAYEARRDSERGREALGRTLGNTSLLLGVVDVVNTTQAMSPFDAQNLARERSMDMMEGAKDLAYEIGSYPSLAQLADDKSDLRVYWKRKAPNEALELLEAGLEGFRK